MICYDHETNADMIRHICSYDTHVWCYTYVDMTHVLIWHIWLIWLICLIWHICLVWHICLYVIFAHDRRGPPAPMTITSHIRIRDFTHMLRHFAGPPRLDRYGAQDRRDPLESAAARPRQKNSCGRRLPTSWHAHEQNMSLDWMCGAPHATARCTRCSVLQCVVVCCSVLQCVAACCSVLQCVVVCCDLLHATARCTWCSVLRCVVV